MAEDHRHALMSYVHRAIISVQLLGDSVLAQVFDCLHTQMCVHVQTCTYVRMYMSVHTAHTQIHT